MPHEMKASCLYEHVSRKGPRRGQIRSAQKGSKPGPKTEVLRDAPLFGGSSSHEGPPETASKILRLQGRPRPYSRAFDSFTQDLNPNAQLGSYQGSEVPLLCLLRLSRAPRR